MSDLELMELHVNVLFRHNSENRMTVVNEPPFNAAPRIYIGGTQEGCVVRYSNMLAESTVEELEGIMDDNPGAHLGEIIRILGSDQEINHFWMGPAYSFPDVRNRPTQSIRITDANKELLHGYFSDFLDDLASVQPCFAVVRDGTAVALCCSARQTFFAAEASLETAQPFWGKAYAEDVTNAWAAEVQNQGRTALYSTSWDNFASQSVARKLHLVRYATDIHIS
ncbi:MAG TPA: GNAT family N-acetyltransferase [Bacillales bacterium]|nr:GNAT family N-acetyltransferase [Bacillales bacterium]